MMKKGEVRKLPEKSSPMWTTQWAYQGSGQDTYIISRRHVAKIIEWACSCPAWTKKTPREHCKHILKMMLLEKLPVANLATGLPKDQQELFMKFLKQQAAAGTPVLEAGAAKPLVRQGRRFR
jgi:hypothetical protein